MVSPTSWSPDPDALIVDAGRPPFGGARFSQIGGYEYESEEDALADCLNLLRPFCVSLAVEPMISEGLRPDIGFRLHEFPNIPLLVECKRFRRGDMGRRLSEAIRQAETYVEAMPEVCKSKAFVGPLTGSSYSDFLWGVSSAGSALLIAGQFNVGALVIQRGGWPNGPAGMLMLANAVVARFFKDANGRKLRTQYHPNAAHLLKYKSRKGSRAWRQ